jgi:hypothetical protein
VSPNFYAYCHCYLAVSRGIVNLHGGCLSATSAGLGFGSTFMVDLPVTLAPTAVCDRGALAQERKNGDDVAHRGGGMSLDVAWSAAARRGNQVDAEDLLDKVHHGEMFNDTPPASERCLGYACGQGHVERRDSTFVTGASAYTSLLRILSFEGTWPHFLPLKYPLQNLHTTYYICAVEYTFHPNK